MLQLQIHSFPIVPHVRVTIFRFSLSYRHIFSDVSLSFLQTQIEPVKYGKFTDVVYSPSPAFLPMAKRRNDSSPKPLKQETSKSKPARPATKPGAKLTLHDRLSQLTLKQAIDLLGEEGRQLLREAPALEHFVAKRDFYLAGDLARVTVRDNGGLGAVVAEVTATLMSGVKHKLHFNCSRCSQQNVTRTVCLHIASVLSLMLEEKTLLGLADVPDLETPFELLSHKKLTQRALHEREERARSE
ncbi:MAG: hypothetical protein FWD31_10170, partial [Planctomycetaceae bacterium]|nr:hypothetical protein [Planctomycetaceae bacterium]